MQLMDVVTAYLYGNLDKDIYIKIPEGFHMPESKSNRPWDVYYVNYKYHSMGWNNPGGCGITDSVSS